MILVTGGCSFSECNFSRLATWPKQLENIIKPIKSYHTGLDSQGNGLISRSIIYRVSELIKKESIENILVGIMWSGPGRHDFFKSDVSYIYNTDRWVLNPTCFIDKDRKWIICNPHWKNEYSVTHYKTFFDEIGAYIYTLEHILRTQWFLKSHNIKYFMTTYTGEVLTNEQKTNKHTAHLYEQIDFKQFLPVEGEYEWCRDNTKLDFLLPNDRHPSSDQHKLFTEQVIIPFLKSKKYVNL
jgi:hypothetical protein